MNPDALGINLFRPHRWKTDQGPRKAMSKFRLPSNAALMHAAILLALALPYCLNLGKSSIWDANEAFYAETPREMLVTGDYLAPQFNFQPRAQKPPLTYYVILISYKLFGVNEFAVRFPGALAAIGVLLFSYATARSLFNPRAALIAAAISATTARIFILARRLPIDILLLFFLTGTLFFIVRAIQENQRIRWTAVYVFAALGFLTKGPIAVVIPAGTCILWMLWSRRSKISVYPVTGGAIFACLVLPWYMLVYRAHGWTYIAPFFLRDNLGRFAAEPMGPSRGLFYYFSVYATDFFPWSILALAALYRLWCLRKKEEPIRNLCFGLPAIWCALIFLLFSFSRNKQEYYIAPLYPAAAVLISGVLDRDLSKRISGKIGIPEGDWGPPVPEVAPRSVEPQHLYKWAWPYGLVSVLLLILSLPLPKILGAFIPGISFMLHYAPSLILIAGVVLLMWSVTRGEFARCFPSLAIPIWTVFMIGALFYVPALESVRPVKSFCRQIGRHWRDKDEAGFFRTSLPSMVYYLRRPIFQESNYEQMMLRFRSNRQVFCVLTEQDYTYFVNKDLKIYILDRRSRFAVRLGTLLNVGYIPGEDLILVTNRPLPQTRSSEGRSPS
jgi:4-amino-4-deoxy-L-arabinose transferase-like glycosyltransferase